MKNKYMPTAISLYLNYFVHGMGVIILAQNMVALSKQWNTNTGGVAIVISSLGIGRLIPLLISGILSDKFGRKPFVILGASTYLLFFAGVLLSPSITIAYIFGILAGMANSFLDSGTYPALMEMFPDSKGTANVIIKAFVSGGQFILPLLISMIVSLNLWYGWSFILCIAILILNLLFMVTVGKFPKIVNEQNESSDKQDSLVQKNKNLGSLWIDGTLFILYGYVSQATFYLVSQWLSQFGSEVAQMGNTSSHALISYYSIGSIVCVFVTAALAKKAVKEIQFLITYTLISFIALLTMYLFPTALICSIMSFVVGFSAAGGVMQLGLTVMSSFFPKAKGTITGAFYTAGSIASFTIPLFTGMMSSNLANIWLFDVIIALLGFVLAVLITLRYRKIFGKI
ncbi:MFS transporter [Ligilactobacillus pobuzihii]|uniref:Permease n=1 Tax=Ligilactobacillus pobuzihii TaxID=449659 RepID=A0A0R2L1K1_9LACO|nr:MFS transporter [Ligilactobacillus pobuzihii]KRK08941.1 permease [Ligilactobacillus pobuzihii E100301 = KCTC 13174]KRN95587.1 permease [Ligilactobacillus pobuzihii]GEN47995.1 MFS transporter [Ligilactobacillus pobuzihii]